MSTTGPTKEADKARMMICKRMCKLITMLLKMYTNTKVFDIWYITSSSGHLKRLFKVCPQDPLFCMSSFSLYMKRGGIIVTFMCLKGGNTSSRTGSSATVA